VIPVKTIGLIGGMSWESTATYYRLINEGVKKQCGALHSAKILLYSVNFAEIEEMQAEERWDDAAKMLGDIALLLEKGGADFILICTNTMHKVASQVEARLAIPLLHIGDATGERIVADNVSTVGLLGTRFTMEQEFYRGRLQEKYGLNVIVPDKNDRAIVDRVIFQELCRGLVDDNSRSEYQRIVRDLAKKGAEAVILGCTEISLLLNPDNSDIVLYDTTALHASQGVRALLSD